MLLQRTWRSAASALLVAALVTAGSAAASTPPGALDRAFESALAAGSWARAAAVADSLVRWRERRSRLDPPGAAALLDSLGRRVFLADGPGAWAASERLFRAALERRERALGPDDPQVAASLSTLSILLGYLGRWPEGVTLAERAATIRSARLGERSPETASSLRQVGLLRFQMGDYAGATGPFERALAIYESLGPAYASKLADAHNNLGELSRVQNRLDLAEQHFRAGVDSARADLAASDPVRLALENNLAGLYKDLGRFDEAEPLLESGLETLESSHGDTGSLATARLNLAEVRRLQGHAAEAAPLYARALSDAEVALGAGHPDLVPFLNQAAVCEQELGHFAIAESLYVRTGAIIDSTLGPDHPLLAQNLVDLARLRLASGRPATADSLLARALAIRERSLGPSHPDVALALVDEARARAREGLEPDEPLERAIAILDSTRAYPDARLDAYAQRAEWNARGGRTAAAVSDMAVALAALDSLRAWRGGGEETRTKFVADRLGLFDRMIRWQLARGDVAGALETHERGRARLLLDQIAASGVDLRAAIPTGIRAPLERSERAAEAMLAASEREIQDTRSDPGLTPRQRLESVAVLEARRDSAAAALSLARRRLEDASPLWRDVLSERGGFPDVAGLRETLVPRDGLLLVYHVGSSESEVFVVPPRGAPQALPLLVDADAAAALGVSAGPLGEIVLESIVTGPGSRTPAGIAGLLGGIPSGGYVELPLRSAEGPDSLAIRLNALWRVLVPPGLRPLLARARTAIVVPDGALHLLAFEALVTRPRGGGRTTRFWLDDGPALSYGPSATALWSLAHRAAPAGAPPAGRAEVLSVSDVDYRAGTGQSSRARAWAPLPGTAAETAAIRDAFGSARVEAITGGAAREPAVRAALAHRRYVHLATHGFVESAGPRLLAGLVLARPPGPITRSDDDGTLELFEIHQLALDCDLAVLSACETGRGPLVAGEGAFALSRGFLAAGARGVVASLWPVDDRSTAGVVGGLFRALAAGASPRHPADTVRALRDAKRRVRRDPRWADPFYWAPFVLSGR